MPRLQLLDDEDDGLTCRLCLQAFWYRDHLNEHLKDAHSIVDPSKYEREEREKREIEERRRKTEEMFFKMGQANEKAAAKAKQAAAVQQSSDQQQANPSKQPKAANKQ